jgi:hypothetical protein
MQDAEPLPSRRGRRGLIALLILLLILLPLYLWPLRGGLGALPGSSTLPGSARDPRSAAALAQIPGDVWDALMGHAHAPPPPPAPLATPPRNLTMITSTEGLPGRGLPGSLDERTGGTTLFDGPALARGMFAQPGSSDLSDASPGGSPELASPMEFVSTPGGGTGPGGAPGGFGPGGYPSLGSLGNLGPWPGAGPGGGPSVVSLAPPLDPGGPGDLAPTPEPATLLLLGSNFALLGAAAFVRRRRRLGIPPIR